jgi:hypothetical protein
MMKNLDLITMRASLASEEIGQNLCKGAIPHHCFYVIKAHDLT